MSTVVVRGLDEEGPGDIVGAFVNEAGVSPADIGAIEIDDDEATVELADGTADDVVVVGDGDTVTAGDVFAAFVEYARERGREVRFPLE